jgi:hypothetical protein
MRIADDVVESTNNTGATAVQSTDQIQLLRSSQHAHRGHVFGLAALNNGGGGAR